MITPARGQFYKPSLFLGLEVGGGASNLLNQNNYGFPKMGFAPAVVTQYGLQAGVALRPWSRIQAAVHWQNAGYSFSDSYASGSTEPTLDLRKTVDVSLLHLSFTYRQHLIPRELSYVGTEKTIELAIRQRHSAYVLAGPRLSFFRKADVAYQKRNDATGKTWQPADILDIKPAFDNYVPIDLIPDHLPEDGRDLYRSMILSLLGGVGWQMHLSPGFLAHLEAVGSISVNDFNSRARGPDGSYLWRRRVYSGQDPKAYFPSTMMTLVISAGLQYSF
jgi:hypothetical protein